MYKKLHLFHKFELALQQYPTNHQSTILQMKDRLHFNEPSGKVTHFKKSSEVSIGTCYYDLILIVNMEHSRVPLTTSGQADGTL